MHQLKIQGEELKTFDREWRSALKAVDSGYMHELTEQVFMGQLREVRRILDGPDAPPIEALVTGRKVSYVGVATMALLHCPMPPTPDEADHIGVIRLLIERGVSVDVVDAFGETAITLAASIGVDDPALIRVLADAGANLNWRDKGGRTALFSHALSRRSKSVEALLEAGATLEIDDAEGTSILSAVMMRGGPAVMAVLKSYLVKHPNLPVRLPLAYLGKPQVVPGMDDLGNGGVTVSPELRALCARSLLSVRSCTWRQS